MKKTYNHFEEIICYIAFGAATTLVNWIVYSFFVKILECGIFLSNGAAWFLSVLFAYVTNKIWVFKSREKNIKGIIKEITLFFGARIVSGIVEMVMLPILVYVGVDQAIFGVHGMLAKVLVSIIVVILNYIFSKSIIFRKY